MTPAHDTPGSELEQTRKAAAGDRDALTALLGTHGSEVRRRIASRIGAHWRSSIDEDDVLQVTYVEAFLRIGAYASRGEGSFLSWLTQIADNNLRDAIRGLERMKRPDPRKRITAPAAATDSYASLVEILGVTSTTPSRHAARHEVVSALDKALEALPRDYAQVIRLYDLQGRDIAEVCTELGKSSGAVYMLRARAHDRLREQMGGASQFFTHAS